MIVNFSDPFKADVDEPFRAWEGENVLKASHHIHVIVEDAVKPDLLDSKGIVDEFQLLDGVFSKQQRGVPRPDSKKKMFGEGLRGREI